MDRQAYSKPYQSLDWESSFGQIMERTRQNITRISNRYGSERVDPMPGMPSTSSGVLGKLPPPPPSLSGATTMGSQKENIASQAHSGSTLLDTLIHRVGALEAQLGSAAEVEARAATDARLRTLEGNMEEMHATIGTVVSQLKEVRKLSSATAQQVARQGAVLESVQQELDLRRGTVARMDSWARQGEAWREEIESQLSGIGKQLRAQARTSAEQAESTVNAATTQDLDKLRERLQLVMQQSVANSVAAHTEQLQEGLKVLERQVAAVRAGRTVGSAGEPDVGSMTDAEVADALSAPQPSELMVRSMVAAEVRELEASVEAAVQTRVEGLMEAAVASRTGETKQDLKAFLDKLAAELGLATSDDEEASSAAARVVAARRSVEAEVKRLADKVDDCSTALMGVQDGAQAAERNLRVEMRGLERRVDESAASASAAATQVTQRSGQLEQLVKDVEASQRSWHTQLRDELYAKSKELFEDWSSDRMAFDKRMIVVEKIVDKFSEKLTTSRDALESMLAGSAEMKTIYSTSSKVDSMSTEMQSMRHELRQTTGSVMGLKATSAEKTEVGELRERLGHMESLTEQLKSIGSMQSSIGQADAALGILKTSMEDAETRIQKLTNVTHTLDTRTESDGKRLSGKLRDVEERLGRMSRELSMQAELSNAAARQQSQDLERTREMVTDAAKAAAQAAADSASSTVEQRGLSFQSAVDGRLSRLEQQHAALRGELVKTQKAAETVASTQALSAAYSSILSPTSQRTAVLVNSASSGTKLPPVPSAQSPPEPVAVSVKETVTPGTPGTPDTLVTSGPKSAVQSATPGSPASPVPVVNLDISDLPSSDGSMEAGISRTAKDGDSAPVTSKPGVVPRNFPSTSADTSVIGSPVGSIPVEQSFESYHSPVKGSETQGDAINDNSDYLTASAASTPSSAEDDVHASPSPKQGSQASASPITQDEAVVSNPLAISGIDVNVSAESGVATSMSLSAGNRSLALSSDYDDGFEDIEELPTVDRVRDEDDEMRSKPIDQDAQAKAAAVDVSGAVDDSSISAADTTFQTAGGLSPMVGQSGASASNGDAVLSFTELPETPEAPNMSRDTASSVDVTTSSMPAETPTPLPSVEKPITTPTVDKGEKVQDNSKAPKSLEKKLKKDKSEGKKSSSIASVASSASGSAKESVPVSSSKDKSVASSRSSKAPAMPPIPAAAATPSNSGSAKKKGGGASKMPPMPKLPSDDEDASSLSSASATRASTAVAAPTAAPAAAHASTPQKSGSAVSSVASASKGLSAKERLRMKLMNRKLEGKK